MSNLITVSLAQLELVCGGKDESKIFQDGAGSERTEIEANGKFSNPAVTIEGGGAYRKAETKDIACLDRLLGKGVDPVKAAEACMVKK